VKLSPPEPRALIAFAMIGMLGWLLWALLFNEVPKENRDLVIALASGIVGACVKDIVGYYYGSSKGASDANARADKALDVATKAQEN